MDGDLLPMNCQNKLGGNFMRLFVAAAMLTTNLALAQAAPAGTTPAPEPAAPVIPADWAAPPPPDKSLVRRAIKESLEAEKVIAAARAKEQAIPLRFTASSRPEQDKYERFADEFDEAKVPGCLGPGGLKRQPTFIFGGLLALPFVAVAAIRGKCN